MNYDRFEALQDEFDQAETEDERGYIAAQMYCERYDCTAAQLQEIIKEEAAIEGFREMDAGALRWCNDQLEPQS